ncbi:MAG: hypothetical protein RIQ59_1486 [Bacteroidota bacterium]
MKKSILSVIAFVSITCSLHAQIPNSGFETWINMGTYENPFGWATLNDLTTAEGVYTAQKGTPGSPGMSYLKLTSKTVGATVVNGIAVSGVINPTTQQPVSGFAFNQQPSAFTGKWQHMIYGSSQGSLNVQLTRWDATTNARIIVATANKNLTGMAMSWANFSIPFVYTDTQAPDSCIIVLKASGNNPTNQDYLWVDNLSFTGNVAGLNALNIFADVAIYPNPTTENFSVNLQSKQSKVIAFELVNGVGDVLFYKNEAIKEGLNKLTIPTIGLAKGSYLVRITSEGKFSTFPVVIN